MFFAACSGLPVLQNNPAKDAPVYGNGGLAVQKGDYLYFANGYTPYANLKAGDNNGNAEYPALYRAKVNAQGKVDVKVEYDDDGEIIFDRAQTIENADIIAKKVVGFESMGLYIFGDYIYYASPNNQKSGNLNLTSRLVDFYRSKLDRSSDPERLYTTKEVGTSVQYTMLQIGSTVYLEVLDGARIIVGKIENGKWRGVNTYVSNATGAALPKVANYEKIDIIDSQMQATLNFNKNIYYTRNLTQEEDNTPLPKGNALCKLDIATGTTTTIYLSNPSITIKGTEGAGIFYERTDEFGNARICFNTMADNGSLAGEQVIKYTTYSDYIFINNILGMGIVGYDGTNMWRCLRGQSDLKLLEGSITSLVKLQGNFVYYTKDSTVSRVHIATPGVGDELISSSDSALIDSIKYIDFDDSYLYYMKKYTNDKGDSYYMHRVGLDKLGDGTFYSEFVGVMQELHYLPEKTDS